MIETSTQADREADACRMAWLHDSQAQAKHRQQLVAARAIIRAARISQDTS